MPLGVVNDEEFAGELANSCAEVKSPTLSVDLDNTEEKVEDDHAPDNRDSSANVNSQHAISGFIEALPSKGRARGDVNTPLALQQLIGDAALTSRRDAVELSSILGLSPSSASAYANGSTSTASYNKPSADISNFLNARKSKIAKRAGVKLLNALDEITPDKLSSAKVTDLAIVAKSMSGIIKDMEPPVVQNQGNTFNGPSIVMFAPPMVDESKFASVTVQE